MKLTFALTITAHSLLLDFLELRQKSPKFADWTEERLAGNLPRLVRLRRLVAMFQAFGLPWDPPSFVQGRFINPEDSRYAAVLSRLTAEVLEVSGHWIQRSVIPNMSSIVTSAQDFGSRHSSS